jgi:protein CpxP
MKVDKVELIQEKENRMKAVNKIFLAAIVIPVALGSMSAFAHGKGPRWDGPQCGGPDGERGMSRMLNLTSEQRDKIRALRDVERDKMRARFDSNRKVMRQYHQQEQQLLLGKNFDEKAARALAQKMVGFQVEQRLEMMHNRFKILSVLTPEQKKQWRELTSTRKAEDPGCRDGFRGPHRGKGPGEPPRPPMEVDDL